MLPHSVLISIMALIMASGNYCLMCLSPSLLALQGQRTWQMEMLNLGWRNQYVNEWVNDERVSYFLLAAAFLSCSLSPWRPSKFGVRVSTSVQPTVKALLCPIIHSEPVVASCKQSVLTAFFTRDEGEFPPHLAVHGAWPAGLSQPQPAVRLGCVCSVTWKLRTLYSPS